MVPGAISIASSNKFMFQTSWSGSALPQTEFPRLTYGMRMRVASFFSDRFLCLSQLWAEQKSSRCETLPVTSSSEKRNLTCWSSACCATVKHNEVFGRKLTSLYPRAGWWRHSNVHHFRGCTETTKWPLALLQGYFKEAMIREKQFLAFSVFQFTIGGQGDAGGRSNGNQISLLALGVPNYFLNGSVQVG